MSEKNRLNGNVNTGSTPAGGSEKTTSFSANFQKLLLPIGITLLGSFLGSPIYLTAFPYLLIMTHMVKSEPGETTLQWWAKYAILQVVYGSLLLVAAIVVFLPVFGTKVTGFHALAFYVPMVTISLHDRRHQYGILGTIIVRAFFDVPLIVAGRICRESFGLRLLAPFCTIYDDTIVQGSFPLPSDIATLAAEPYNVGLIINMCREYTGATEEMNNHGILQCHLPHQDTTAVSYESLVKGCAFIRQFRKKHPKKRVFVHCKGGIARASTMALAHYVYNEGQDPAAAIQAMKSKRDVVFVGVKDFPAIVRLDEERLANQKLHEDATKSKSE